REVHAWSKLRHKNVLPLLGITTEFPHTISFVSAWMAKGNAHDYVQDKAVDPRPLVRCRIEGIARGLQYLHERKPGSIFHGDLKGSNVLISSEGRALLTDFGLSRVVNSSLKMTADKICGGTLNWMAPEILDGKEVSAEGDVWAFGMTALELFTGKVPYHDRREYLAVLCAITRGPPTRPSEDETFSRLTDNWWEMCSSCWNRQPFLRPPMSHVVKSISLLCTGKAGHVVAVENRFLGVSGLPKSPLLCQRPDM
ncbi:kinase-like domain-containing protein, partial [Scleroderma citrinum]